jgi:hypothetical protein
MQTLAPWQGSPEWSFQISHRVVQRGVRGSEEFAVQEGRLAEGVRKGNEALEVKGSRVAFTTWY